MCQCLCMCLCVDVYVCMCASVSTGEVGNDTRSGPVPSPRPMSPRGTDLRPPTPDAPRLSLRRRSRLTPGTLLVSTVSKGPFLFVSHLVLPRHGGRPKVICFIQCADSLTTFRETLPLSASVVNCLLPGNPGTHSLLNDSSLLRVSGRANPVKVLKRFDKHFQQITTFNLICFNVDLCNIILKVEPRLELGHTVQS